MSAHTIDTKPFARFEWVLALRYLRSRRKEGFISVIAGFSFLGIVLGVATLIIVMAVMNGFRKELFNKILGLDGHVLIYKIGGDFGGYDEAVRKLGAVPGVRHAHAGDRGPGDRLDLGAGAGRQGARHERGRREVAQDRLQQRAGRHLRRLRRARRHRHRPAPRQPAARQHR